MLHLLWTVGSIIILLIGITFTDYFWIVVGVLLLGIEIVVTETE